MGAVLFVIPDEPAGKGRHRHRQAVSRKTGASFVQVYSPKETVNRESFIRKLAYDAMAGSPPMAGPIEVTIDATCRPTKSMSKKLTALALAGNLWPTKKPDLDNIEKLILDAVKGVAWTDDVQVVRVFKEKRYGLVARTIVRISMIPPQQAAA